MEFILCEVKLLITRRYLCVKNNNSELLKLIIIFVLFLVLWLITSTNPMKLDILWFLVVLILSFIFIVKNKNISKGDIIAGVLMGLISMPSNFLMGLISIIAYLGGVSVFKASNNKILLLKSNNKREISKTILVAVFVGIILGIINLYLGKSFMEINPSIKLKWFLVGIRAGVTEEIIFRFFFFAICIYFTNDKALSKIEGFLCYLIMIIPHVLIHFDRTNFELGGMIILSLIFGLPFAIMQRKHDLSSAIGAHAIVDIIRFCVFGA